jgi:hypothetical protein
VLRKSNPEDAERLMKKAQDTVNRRWANYEYLSQQQAVEFEHAG